MLAGFEYTRLKGLLELNHRTFGAVSEGIAELNPIGKLHGKQSLEDLEAACETVIAHVKAAKDTLTKLVRDTESILRAAKHLTKGGPRRSGVSNHGWRGDIEGNAKLLIKEAQRQIRIIDELTAAVRSEKTTRAARVTHAIEGINDIKEHLDEFNRPGMDLGPAQAMLSVMIFLIALWQKKWQNEVKKSRKASAGCSWERSHPKSSLRRVRVRENLRN